jgi:hypothetical protein
MASQGLGDYRNSRVRKLHSLHSGLILALTWELVAAIVGFVMHGFQNIALIKATTMAMCTTTCTPMRHSGESAV